jgi:hypothetical protein
MTKSHFIGPRMLGQAYRQSSLNVALSLFLFFFDPKTIGFWRFDEKSRLTC